MKKHPDDEKKRDDIGAGLLSQHSLSRRQPQSSSKLFPSTEMHSVVGDSFQILLPNLLDAQKPRFIAQCIETILLTKLEKMIKNLEANDEYLTKIRAKRFLKLTVPASAGLGIFLFIIWVIIDSTTNTSRRVTDPLLVTAAIIFTLSFVFIGFGCLKLHLYEPKNFEFDDGDINFLFDLNTFIAEYEQLELKLPAKIEETITSLHMLKDKLIELQSSLLGSNDAAQKCSSTVVLLQNFSAHGSDLIDIESTYDALGQLVNNNIQYLVIDQAEIDGIKNQVVGEKSDFSRKN